MTHTIVGLFDNAAKAGKAVAELRTAGFTKDISLIAKHAKDGKVRMYQIKHEDTELKESGLGAELGTLGGIIGGLSVVLNPVLAAPAVVAAFAVAMGVAGAALGATFGEYINDLTGAGLPPERAKEFKDKIHSGQVFVSVADTKGADDNVRTIFESHGASYVHVLNTEK